jgi:hypothetical protein
MHGVVVDLPIAPYAGAPPEPSELLELSIVG